MHDGMPYGRNQAQGQGHSREVDRQSPTGLIFYFIIFYSLLFFIILLGMDPKCLLTLTDLQTRRARCQHQLSFLSVM